MKIYQFCLPRKIIFGSGSVSRLSSEAKELEKKCS